MQKTNVIGGTIGEILFSLSKATQAEKPNLLKVLEERIITKYPNEEKILERMIKEAMKGKTYLTLWNGVLAPDFSEENITTKVIDNHTVVDWNKY